MKSFTYYLSLLYIKIKGVKKSFSKAPIDYQLLRKEDLHNPDPKIFNPHRHKTFFIEGAPVTEIEPKNSSGKIIIFLHGGAFVYGPVKYHWNSAVDLATHTKSLVWMVNYPKAPEADIQQISTVIDRVYKTALRHHPLKKVILAGDSVGGTLISALVQRLILIQQPLPSLVVLISPVMDASLSNPHIGELDRKDPILSRTGALSAKRMAARKLGLKDPMISPLYGSFINFPTTLLFIAENDITRPDQELSAEKMKKEKVELKVFFGEGMPHIWPLLPVLKEGKLAFKELASAIRKL